jgi:hypothetical protein
MRFGSSRVSSDDARWLQTTPAEDAIFLKQIYLDPLSSGKAIGTRVMHIIIDEA